MNTPGNGRTRFELARPDIKAHIAFMTISKKLARGELVGAEAVDPTGEAGARGRNGAPVTDGVFPESKEFSPATGSWTSRCPSARMPAPPRRRRLGAGGKPPTC